jgi:hypothetical protein
MTRVGLWCSIHSVLWSPVGAPAGVPGPRRNADDCDAGWFAPVATRRRPMLGALWAPSPWLAVLPGGTTPRTPRCRPRQGPASPPACGSPGASTLATDAVPLEPTLAMGDARLLSWFRFCKIWGVTAKLACHAANLLRVSPTKSSAGQPTCCGTGLRVRSTVPISACLIRRHGTGATESAPRRLASPARLNSAPQHHGTTPGTAGVRPDPTADRAAAASYNQRSRPASGGTDPPLALSWAPLHRPPRQAAGPSAPCGVGV